MEDSSEAVSAAAWHVQAGESGHNSRRDGDRQGEERHGNNDLEKPLRRRRGRSLLAPRLHSVFVSCNDHDGLLRGGAGAPIASRVARRKRLVQPPHTIVVTDAGRALGRPNRWLRRGALSGDEGGGSGAGSDATACPCAPGSGSARSGGAGSGGARRSSAGSGGAGSGGGDGGGPEGVAAPGRPHARGVERVDAGRATDPATCPTFKLLITLPMGVLTTTALPAVLARLGASPDALHCEVIELDRIRTSRSIVCIAAPLSISALAVQPKHVVGAPEADDRGHACCEVPGQLLHAIPVGEGGVVPHLQRQGAIAPFLRKSHLHGGENTVCIYREGSRHLKWL
mmetsp:Transcript_27027/g.60870  ORF Transcript_27027/g.60870 Transcript_27027/m.60870 type:complete len:341 (-) Transcript_27027:402-1424(-)